jgi:hypothetical protein
MDLLDRIHRAAFLGPEFLTWLWYESDRREGIFDLGGDIGQFELWFDDKLVVSSAAVNAQENFFKGGHPTSSLEAKMALKLGKMAVEAKLRIVRDGQEWSFSLKAHDLGLSGVKLPTILSREDEEKFYERMTLAEQLEDMVRGVYGQFLKKRLAPEWETELASIREWVAA